MIYRYTQKHKKNPKLIYGEISSSYLLNELNIRVRDSKFTQRARFRDKRKHKHNHYLLNESKNDVESPFVMMKKKNSINITIY